MGFVTGVRLDQIESRISYQLCAHLKNDHMDNALAFDSAIDILLMWLKETKLASLPQLQDAIGDGKRSISHEHYGYIVEIINFEEKKSWGFKLSQPDSNVAARTWTTQAVIKCVNKDVLFTCSCLYANPTSTDDPVSLSTPGFIRSLSEQIGLYDISSIDGIPWNIENKDDLAKLKSNLVDAERLLPVIVISEKRNSDGTYIKALDPVQLSRDVLGLAHVVVVPHRLSYTWSEMLPPKWSVYDGAVRIYNPGLVFNESEYTAHPLTFLSTVSTWNYQGFEGDKAFIKFLTSYVRRHNITLLDLPNSFDLFSELKRAKNLHSREENRRNTQDDKALITLLNEQVDIYEIQLREKESQIAGTTSEYMKLVDAYEEAKKEKQALVSSLQSLRYVQAQSQPREDIEIPNSINDIEEWCEKHFSDRLMLSGKSKRALKSSQFEKTELLYKSIRFLAIEYRNYKYIDNNAETKSAYEKELAELGIEDLGSPISDNKRGEYRHVYEFGYGEDMYDIDQHIGYKGRGNLDPRYCMRIYFTWDTQSQRILIGSLPAHLDTDISN